MAKDATVDQAVTSHDETAVTKNEPLVGGDLKTDEVSAAAAAAGGRRQSVALNIVENPLTVGRPLVPFSHLT